MTLRPRLLSLLLAALTLPLSQVLFPGCATMIDGPTQHIGVKSQPTGARVFLNGRLIGSTPATVVVSRWGIHRLRVEMPGYQPIEIPLEKKASPYVEGNLFIGGIWIVIDTMTGAIFTLDLPSRPIDGVRAVTEPGPLFGPTALTISTTLKPDASARRIGQLQRK
jgi:hypothetical protein